MDLGSLVRIQCAECGHVTLAAHFSVAADAMDDHCEAVGHEWRMGNADTLHAEEIEVPGRFCSGPQRFFVSAEE
jgi:hypothetical protein